MKESPPQMSPPASQFGLLRDKHVRKAGYPDKIFPPIDSYCTSRLV